MAARVAERAAAVRAGAEEATSSKRPASAKTTESRPPLPREIPLMSTTFVGAWMSQQQLDDGRGELVEQLYETRLASLQRFVGFAVMFYRLAQLVANFWRCAPLGVPLVTYCYLPLLPLFTSRGAHLSRAERATPLYVVLLLLLA